MIAHALKIAHPLVWMTKMVIFGMIFGNFKVSIKGPLQKKWRKNDTTLCCKFQNLLLDHQTYGSIFILVSNGMVYTGNHTVTMLIFSVFCFPMITDDKIPGYTVTFYTCKQKLLFYEYIWNFKMS